MVSNMYRIPNVNNNKLVRHPRLSMWETAHTKIRPITPKDEYDKTHVYFS
jgi:hypothetical protein